MDIKRERLIGKGSYGLVYEATTEAGKVAVKRMLKEVDTTGCANPAEFSALSTCNGHPTIVQTICILDKVDTGTSASPKKGQKMGRSAPLTPITKYNFSDSLTDNPFHPVFELARCDLDAMLEIGGESVNSLTLNQRVRLFHHLLCALEWLHREGIIHRDIKPQNLLVFGDDPNTLVLKLADFGLVRRHTTVTPSTPGTYTRSYRPPEVALNMSDYDYRADVWAAGALFYFMLTGDNMFSPKSDEEVIPCILRRHENTFLSTEEFAELFGETIEKDLIDDIPYRVNGERALRAERLNLDLLSDFYSDGTEETESTIASCIQMLREMLTISPTDRPTIAELLDGHASVFERVDPDAAAIRAASNAFPSDAEVWKKNIIPSRYVEEHSVVVDLVQRIVAAEAAYITDEPRILIHALDTYEKYLIWRDTIESAEPGQASEADLRLVRDIPSGRSAFIAAAHLHYKQYVTMTYCSFTQFLTDIRGVSQSAHAEALKANGRVLEDGRSELEVVDGVMLGLIHNFNAHNNTLFEAVVTHVSELDIENLGDQIALFCLSNYSAINADEDIPALVDTWAGFSPNLDSEEE